MKPNSSFKLDKQIKRAAAFIKDKQQRNSYIKMMIGAQISAQHASLKPLKSKDTE